MVLGILSVLLFSVSLLDALGLISVLNDHYFSDNLLLVVVSFVLSLFSVSLGFIGYRAAHKKTSKGKLFTIAAIVLGMTPSFIILAVVLLVIIRGPFCCAPDEQGDIIPAVDLEHKPSSQEPLTTSTSRLEIKRGQAKILQIGYYNTQSSIQYVTPQFCHFSEYTYQYDNRTETTTYFSLKFKNTSQEIRPSQALGWRVVVFASLRTPTGNYSCNVSINNVIQDFFLSVS